MTKKSKGHLFFARGRTDFEYFDSPDGEIYRVKVDNPFGTNKCRMGARWEYPAHMQDDVPCILSRVGFTLEWGTDNASLARKRIFESKISKEGKV